MDRCDSCGKTGDNLKKCVQCESVMYCNKDCQRAAWKIHRKACHPNPAAATAANAASVDALTNAVAGSSLGDATKKEYTDHVICQYCGVDASAKRLNCSKCKNTHYCSRECQVKHWPIHKQRCQKAKEMKTFAAEHGFKFQTKLLAEWKQTDAKAYMNYAARYALTGDMFREQPPTVVAFFTIGFDYNRRTFVPIEPPSPMRIVDLPDNLRGEVLNAIQGSADAKARSMDPEMKNSKTHVIVILDGQATSISPVNMAWMDTLPYTWDQIMLLFESVHLESKRFRTWQASQLMNLQAQFKALEDTNISAWTAFVHHSFRLYSKKPLHKTHALLINYTFGRQLGQVKAVTSYELISLSEARRLAESCGDREQTRFALEHVLDVENSPRLLQSRVWRPKNILLPLIFVSHLDSVFAMFQPTLSELLEHANISLNSSDQQAQRSFRVLQAVSFPPVSSPSLN